MRVRPHPPAQPRRVLGATPTPSHAGLEERNAVLLDCLHGTASGRPRAGGQPQPPTRTAGGAGQGHVASAIRPGGTSRPSPVLLTARKTMSDQHFSYMLRDLSDLRSLEPPADIATPAPVQPPAAAGDSLCNVDERIHTT